MSKVRGFTLIELLIVIAVLGVLAVAVLSAINPIEQINRSKDTGSRSDAEQLLSAIDRYYASKTYYPWQVDADSDETAVNPMVEIETGTQPFGVDAEEMLTKLSVGGTSELKASFINRIVGDRANNLWIYNHGVAGESTYVCFVPDSSAFRDEAWLRCTTGGAPAIVDFPPDACPNDATCQTAATSETATGCYICLP